MNKLLLSVVFIFLIISQSIAREEPGDLFHYSKKKVEALILKVSNSDLIVLENGQRVRLIGIESAGLPERKLVLRDKDGMIIEEKEDAFIPLEEQAITYAQDLLEGKKVILEYDSQSVDQDGSKLAYVFLPDGRLANAELLRQGFVYLKIRPPNVKYADKLRSAYKQAKQEQRGFLGG